MDRAGADTGHGKSGPALSLAPLMLAAFTGSMAMMAFVAVAGPLAHILSLAPWHLGSAMAIAGVAWILMSRVWGVRSDRVGRRPVLLLSLGGFALAYLSLALFVDAARQFAFPAMLSFAGLVVGRAVMGTFYAAVPVVAAAVVADTVAPARRAKSMAAIGAASSAGMVVGPGLAGLMGEWSLVLPLYITALLPIAALVLLWSRLPGDPPVVRAPKPAPRLSDRRLHPAMAFGFAAAFCVAIAQIVIGFYVIDRLALDPFAAAEVAGGALAIVGVALVATQTSIQKVDWPPIRLIAIGSLVAAAGFAVTALAASVPLVWAGYAVVACGMGMIYPAVPALAANCVEAGEQGAAAGSVAMAQGMGVVIGPLVGTAAYAVFPALPYALCAAGLAVAAIGARAGFKRA